ncbi:MAG: hypothetical protein WA421_02660 [Nitrososphaeraceae archaeon]
MEQLCALLPNVAATDLQRILTDLIPESVVAQLIQFLIDAGVQFRTT